MPLFWFMLSHQHFHSPLLLHHQCQRQHKRHWCISIIIKIVLTITKLSQAPRDTTFREPLLCNSTELGPTSAWTPKAKCPPSWGSHDGLPWIELKSISLELPPVKTACSHFLGEPKCRMHSNSQGNIFLLLKNKTPLARLYYF